MEKTSVVILTFANLAGFAAVIVVNALANILPLNGVGTGELSDLYPNLFVPAGLTFSIWGLIYLLLAGFSIYSIIAVFNSNFDAGFLTKINFWFLISCAANTGWIFAWHWKRPGLSLLLMALLLASLIFIYLRINGTKPSGTTEILFTRLPFSVYLGWITVATIANITAFLVSINWPGFGISETVWTVIVIAAAALIGCIAVFSRRDTGFALVIIWAMLGIVIKRNAEGDAPAVVIAAIAAIVFITAALLIKALGFRLRN